MYGDYFATMCYFDDTLIQIARECDGWVVYHSCYRVYCVIRNLRLLIVVLYNVGEPRWPNDWKMVLNIAGDGLEEATAWTFHFAVWCNKRSRLYSLCRMVCLAWALQESQNTLRTTKLHRFLAANTKNGTYRFYRNVLFAVLFNIPDYFWGIEKRFFRVNEKREVVYLRIIKVF